MRVLLVVVAAFVCGQAVSARAETDYSTRWRARDVMLQIAASEAVL
jgi:hypothetical protein